MSTRTIFPTRLEVYNDMKYEYSNHHLVRVKIYNINMSARTIYSIHLQIFNNMKYKCAQYLSNKSKGLEMIPHFIGFQPSAKGPVPAREIILPARG